MTELTDFLSRYYQMAMMMINYRSRILNLLYLML